MSFIYVFVIHQLLSQMDELYSRDRGNESFQSLAVVPITPLVSSQRHGRLLSHVMLDNNPSLGINDVNRHTGNTILRF